MRRGFAAVCFALLLAACGAPQAPVGVWTGTHETEYQLIAVKLQILPGNRLKVVAPNGAAPSGAYATAERAGMRAELKRAANSTFAAAEVVPVSFDGRTIRREGRIAPLFDVEADGTLIFHFYRGHAPTVRIRLTPEGAGQGA